MLEIALQSSTWGLWIYILSPILFYLFFLVIFFVAYLHTDESIESLFMEKESVEHPVRSAKCGKTLRFLPFSQSRLVLFMAGVCCSLIAICCTSVYIYTIVYELREPDFDGLKALVTALGLSGALPYIANKASRAWGSWSRGSLRSKIQKAE